MRAVVSQVCQVCGRREPSKALMTAHIEDFHGNNWPPGMLTRAEDQGEFRPCLSETPWGVEFKQGPRR